MIRFQHSANLPSWNLVSPTAVVAFVVLGLAPLFGWALAGERWFIFVALTVIAFVPVLVRWPVVSTFGPYAFLAASLDALPLLPGGASLTKPVGLLAGAVMLTAGIMERRLGRPPRAALWWGLFMVCAIVSSAWAIDADLVFGRLRTALSLFFLYLVAVSFRPTRRELYSICALTVLGGVLAASLAYAFGFNESIADGDGRGTLVLGDMYTDPNTLGRILLVPLALAIAGLVGWRAPLQRAITAACVAAIGAGIFISMSRGAVVSMIVMLCVLLYRLRARGQVLAALILLVAVTATMPDAFYERMGSVISLEDATGSGRTEIWKTGLSALGEFGLLGAGLDNFAEVYRRYVGGQHVAGAHNVYLAVWVELGIVGLVLMLGAITSALRDVWLARGMGRNGVVLSAAEAAAFGVLTSAMFIDDLWRKSFWLVWILLTWAVCSERGRDGGGDAGVTRR